MNEQHRNCSICIILKYYWIKDSTSFCIYCYILSMFFFDDFVILLEPVLDKNLSDSFIYFVIFPFTCILYSISLVHIDIDSQVTFSQHSFRFLPSGHWFISLFAFRADYQYNPRGSSASVKKRILITHNLRLLKIKTKDYGKGQTLHNFMLEEVTFLFFFFPPFFLSLSSFFFFLHSYLPSITPCYVHIHPSSFFISVSVSTTF